MSERLAIIGAGAMGAALCRGLRDTVDIVACDRHAEKLAALDGVATCTDPKEAIAKADAVLFAVKPQAFDACLADAGPLPPDTLILSIMAGIPLAALVEKTGCSAVVRAMPNLGVAVGNGSTAWIATDAVSDEQIHFVRNLFSRVGTGIALSSEAEMDAFTAIAGCGPAYFFLLADLLARHAHAMGFATQDADAMARGLLIASGKLLESKDDTPADWKRAVASKGGVTERALHVLEDGRLDALLQEALEAARARSAEMHD